MAPILLLLLGVGAAAVVIGGGSKSSTLRKPKGLGKYLPVVRMEDPATAGQVGSVDPTSTEVAMPDDIRQAWDTVIDQSVFPFVRIAEDGRPVGERRNIGFADGEPTENGEPNPTVFDWAGPVAAGRPFRDAFAFGVLRVGYAPDETKATGVATAEKVKQIAGQVGEAIGTISGAISFAGAALVSVGVSTSTVGAIMGAVGSAIAAVGPAVGFLAAAVAVQAAIVGVFYAVLGEASGSTFYGYIADGAQIDESISNAIHARDKGARLSTALGMIQRRSQVDVLPDGMELQNGQDWAATVNVPTFADDQIGGQKKLEAWTAEFLRKYEGLPRLRPMTAKQVSDMEKMISYAPSASRSALRQKAVDDATDVAAFGWLFHSPTAGSVDMKGARKMLALFAGLGENESEWLSKAPGTRGGPFKG